MTDELHDIHLAKDRVGISFYTFLSSAYMN